MNLHLADITETEAPYYTPVHKGTNGLDCMGYLAMREPGMAEPPKATQVKVRKEELIKLSGRTFCSECFQFVYFTG